MSKISTPDRISGFPEFLPEEQMEFNRLRAIVVKHYELHGFLPLETPAMERLHTLMAKATEEDQKLVYGVDKLVDGRFPSDRPPLGLPFDLTVPLARYVAQHHGQLDFPFRRYQIERVHRGERAGDGRFREFYQADIDVIGSEELPLLHDAEMPAVIYGIFKEMQIGKFRIRINNRKIHNGILDHLGIPLQYSTETADDRGEPVVAVCNTLSIIDAMPKIGREQAEKAFHDDVGVSSDKLAQLMEFLNLEGSSSEMVQHLQR